MFTEKQKRLRLENEYEAMEALQKRCDWLRWDVAAGNAPHVTEYRLTVQVPTVIDAHFKMRDSHEITVALPSTFPDSAPNIVMTSRPEPYHPNWWSDGRWCFGGPSSWDPETDLVDHILRMVRTLKFDLEVSNPQSATDNEKARWYCDMRDKGKFPLSGALSDGFALAPGNAETFVIQEPEPTEDTGVFRIL